MSVRLITFATEDYSVSANRLKATALRYGANDVVIFHPDQIWYGLNFHFIKPLLKDSRGHGWWIWKPIIIWAAINELKDGDILIYCDAGNDIVDDLNHIISKMDEDIFLFSNGWRHSHWCKAETAIAINGGGYVEDGKISALPPNYLTHKQVQASSIFFRVSQKTRDFIQEWLAWSIMPGFIDNTPRGPQFPEFQEHRHDQAIICCLQIKYGYKLHWFPSTTAMHLERSIEDSYPATFLHHRKRNHEW